MDRGYFKFWGFDKKRQLYFKGRKTYEYNVSYDRRGTFVDTHGMFFDKEAYNEKKEQAVKSIDFEGQKEKKWKLERDLTIKGACQYGISQPIIASWSGLTQQQISYINKHTKIKEQNKGTINE